MKKEYEKPSVHYDMFQIDETIMDDPVVGGSPTIEEGVEDW